MKKWTIVVAAAAFASVASAQNAEAFKEAQFLDVFINGSGNSYTLTLGANPMVNQKGTWQEVKNIEGFWLISDQTNMQGHGSDIGEWAWHQNIEGNGSSSTFGWQTQQKNALKAGDSMTFTFDSINTAGLEAFGLKVHAQGTAAHLRMNAQPIPEPAGLLALASGAVVLLRKRRKK